MTADVELLPLPAAYRLLRKNADGDWVTDGRPWCDGMPDGDLVRDSAKSGQYRIEYAYAAASLQAEIESLRAEAAEWKRVASAQAELHDEAEARAERLAEALREMREYVTAALQAEREAFAGHEDCSDIPGIEADLHNIDAMLREQEEGA